MGNLKIVIPRATTNLLNDPGLEVSNGGWSGSKSAIAGSAIPLKGTGTYRLNGLGGGAYIGRQTSGSYGPSGGVIFVSGWIWVPAATGDWNSGDISIETFDLTGATVEKIKTWKQATDPREKWFQIISKIQLSTDTVGNIQIVSSGTLVVDDYIEIDCWQIELQPDTFTTYCDGEEEGCFWEGAKHDSNSSRVATSRAGGAVFDFADDLGFQVQNLRGAGFPQIENVFRDRALVDGQEFLRTKVKGFNISFNATVSEDTLGNFHAARKELIEAMRPDSDGGSQPFIIQYTGAGDTKELKVRLEGGLSLNKGTGFHEKFVVRFVSEEPYWKTFGDYFESLTATQNTSSGGLQRRTNNVAKDAFATLGEWDSIALNNSSHTTFNRINVLFFNEDDGYLYVGGDFTGFAGVIGGNYIVRYDVNASSWSRLGGSGDVNGVVNAIVKRPQGGVYVGGNFTSVAADSNKAGFCAWTGSGWEAVPNPSGTSGSTGTNVNDIAIGKDEQIYVCGSFTNFAGSTNADGIAVFDPAADAWDDSLGSRGLASYALATAPNGDIYFGGDWDFAAIDGQAYNIARWDGSNWYTLGTGIGGTGNPLVEAIFVDENGDVYVTGSEIEVAGGFAVSNAAVWNGSSWAPMGSGFTAVGYSIARVGSEIVFALDASGPGTAGGIRLTSGIAFWDGSGWRGASLQHNFTGARAVADVNGDLYVGFDGVAATIYKGVANSITPVGDAKAFPKIIFTNESGNDKYVRLFSIVNETTGAALYFNQRVLDHETITIDLDPGNRKMESSLFGRTWNILPSSDVVDFFLEPGVENIISAWFERDPTGYSYELSMSVPIRNWGVD